MIRIQYYLKDDCDTLLCKLENIANDYYYYDKPCNIDKIESDIERLEMAISINDYKTMRSLLNNYMALFKRYR
jgi:uncharacterized protein YerC